MISPIYGSRGVMLLTSILIQEENQYLSNDPMKLKELHEMIEKY